MTLPNSMEIVEISIHALREEGDRWATRHTPAP